ncbi:MAG: polysaccharide biosynthesis tyrosine autokinase [Chloroflexi bacterium]|nr:polysaccharide biosynthesis tyrosine autokinase [Chloroflexota bacterium]
MELRQYAAILWRWLWLIVLGAAVAAGVAYLVNTRTIPVYEASATLYINAAKGVVGEGNATPGDLMLGRTYVELMRKRPVLDEVVKRLQIDLSAGQLAAGIRVQPIRDTQLLIITVSDVDPTRAALVANEVPKVFIQQNEDIQTRRFQESKAALSKQLDRISSDIARSQQAVADLRSLKNPDLAEMDRLQRDLQVSQTMYATLLKSYEEIRLAEARQVDTLVMVEPAEPPTRPVRPQTIQNTLLAGVVGAMIALGLAFLKEYLDDTVKTPDDIERICGFSTLGAIARIPGKARESRYLLRLESRSPVAEAYRSLRTSISFSGIDRPVRTLLVTSPRPGEGKTTTAINVSSVMAQAGMKVVLVDTDLRRPSLHRAFGLSNEAGLTTLLLNRAAPSDGVLQATPVENLRIVTSGPIPPNPSELLASHRMSDLVTQLAAEADVVVFDSPPLLAVTDAMVLAPQVDGTMLVLEAGTTREPALRQAAAELAKVGARVLGVVFNKVPTSGGHGYYYYYYYYRGYYHSENGKNGSGGQKPSGKSDTAGPLVQTARRVLGLGRNGAKPS